MRRESKTKMKKNRKRKERKEITKSEKKKIYFSLSTCATKFFPKIF